MARRPAARVRIGLLALAISAPLPFGQAIAASPGAVRSQPTLLTAEQRQLNSATIAILRDSAVRAAREALLKRWAALPQAALPDGKATLQGAVDEVSYFAAEVAVQRILHPDSIAWIAAPPFAPGIPGTRSGLDDPDRIYRLVAVDPAQSYVIEGTRRATPSNDDFPFEASANSLRTLGGLDARDIDVAADGRFRITLDGKPADGARNHLTLPPGTNAVLIRDTLADWNRQTPNRLEFRQVDGPARRGSIDEARRLAAALIEENARFLTPLLSSWWECPANAFTAKVRTLKDGLPGYIFATARFSLKSGEALVVTLDPQAARYAGFELTDPWSRSVPYWTTFGSLSNEQAQRNADGSLTLIVSQRDPGYANWVGTNGLSEGIVGVRIENMPQPSTVDAATVVREARVVPVSALAAALPPGAVRVATAARARALAERTAGFRKRVLE